MTGKKTETSNSAKKGTKITKINAKENGKVKGNVLRHRRAQSVGRVADETARETRITADNPDNPYVQMFIFFFEIN